MTRAPGAGAAADTAPPPNAVDATVAITAAIIAIRDSLMDE
ncbi:hypothetical protein [Rhodococcus sp. JS3073]|nr:hypothetical protein [Rhodococcus sp. JS3073]WAM18959.1 hypothetical protein OYT95_24295 [Rhodococcus sp. JS3073]